VWASVAHHHLPAAIQSDGLAQLANRSDVPVKADAVEPLPAESQSDASVSAAHQLAVPAELQSDVPDTPGNKSAD
jgi:hypothetical protein